MVTQQDVAQRAGVSFITVSRVVNNMGNVKPETREKVLKAIEELRYYPNSLGRALNSNRLNILGIIVPTLPGVNIHGTAYYSGLMVGVERACSENGFDMLVSTQKYTESGYDYLKTYYERKSDGLLMVAPDISHPHFEIISEEHIPCVVVGERPEKTGISYVDVDNINGARELTQQVIQKGHRRIAFLKGIVNNGNARERLKGFLSTMEEEGLAVPEEWILEGDMTRDSGRTAFSRLMSLNPRPTALICVNDVMAHGILDEARSRGLIIPNALSVVGYDGLDSGGWGEPSLCTVQQPIEEMGYRAGTMLIQQIQGVNKPMGSIVFPVRYIEGDSLGRPRH